MSFLENFYLARVRSLRKKPEHIAIIMDGNGRWAQKRGLPRTEGHRHATRAIRRTVEGCRQAGIPHLSLFAFSTENWHRPAEEVETILRLIGEQLEENLSELNSQGVRIRLVGERERLPDWLVSAFTAAEEQTSANKKLNLYLLVNYSGKQEILMAVKKILVEQPTELTEEIFRRYLYVPEAPYPDLIIRTSGEKRLSNFYLWQAAYAELYFTPVLWPDFQKIHLYRAILNYSHRKRRFGGLEEF